MNLFTYKNQLKNLGNYFSKEFPPVLIILIKMPSSGAFQLEKPHIN